MDVAVGDGDVIEQCLPGLALVGLRIAGRDVALVTEEDPHPGPVDALGGETVLLFGGGGVERRESAENPDPGSSAGEYDAGDAVAVPTPAVLYGVDNIDEAGGRLHDEGILVGNTVDDDHGRFSFQLEQSATVTWGSPRSA